MIRYTIYFWNFIIIYFLLQTASSWK